MSKFQLILLIVFGSFILLAVMIFSLTRSSGSASATVVVWGDIPAYDWNNLVNLTDIGRDRSLTVNYVEKDPESFMQEFTEALAEGRAPDLVIIPLADFWSQKNRLIPIPYSSISERDFKATFIEEGELFLSKDGIYALPLSVDPLVLYYNRDLLTRAGIAEPMRYWDEIYDASLKLTKKDGANNITKSVVALGEANNIDHFKDILSLLMLQAGTPITSMTSFADTQELSSQINVNPGFPSAPAESALDFYTQFSNPARAFYSWNRSQLPSQTHFIAGDTAYYIGYASELRLLRAKNPTLNMGVAPVPQSRVSENVLTFGQLKGVAISRSSKNPGAAFLAAMKIVSRDSASTLSGVTFLPPARRDLLGIRPEDSVMSVFYEAALQSKGWIDPHKNGTKAVFREMIESVTSGRARVNEAVNSGHREVEELIR